MAKAKLPKKMISIEIEESIISEAISNCFDNVDPGIYEPLADMIGEAIAKKGTPLNKRVLELAEAEVQAVFDGSEYEDIVREALDKEVQNYVDTNLKAKMESFIAAAFKDQFKSL